MTTAIVFNPEAFNLNPAEDVSLEDCRTIASAAGLASRPDAAVLMNTVRALMYSRGVDQVIILRGRVEDGEPLGPCLRFSGHRSGEVKSRKKGGALYAALLANQAKLFGESQDTVDACLPTDAWKILIVPEED